MDPLIIFQGKNLQSSWLSKNTMKCTYFAVSKSGWMTTTQSPAASKKSKERPQLPFSVAAFDQSMESTTDTNTTRVNS